VTAQPAEAPRQPSRPPVAWRRNLAFLWITQFTAFFGYSFVNPFLAVYLHNDLGVRGASGLALWTGLALGSAGITMAVANPLWGVLGDRVGLKPSIARAMIGGGVSIVLMGFVQTPLQMVGARALLGAFAGAQVPAQALVAAETPSSEVGRSLGLLASAIGLARTIGPLVGGVLAVFFTLRRVFIASGIALTLAVALVIVGVHETPRARLGKGATRAGLRSIVAASRRSILALIGTQGLVQFTFNACQALLALRLIALDPAHSQLLVGLAFGSVGVTTVVSSMNYWRFAGSGYRLVGIATCATMALSLLLTAAAPGAALVVAAAALLGLAWGAVNPTISTLIGLEAPASVRGTVFGFNASALAAGLAAGPIAAGVAAALAGVPAALVICASAAVLAAVLVAWFVREPPTVAAVAG
jgi:MFS family permease